MPVNNDKPVRWIPLKDGTPTGPTTPAPLPIICQHRGEVLRVELCKLCGQRGNPLEVYSCGIHGECTHRKWKINQTEAVCIGCPDGPWS